jgi:multiple sugar transport system ATP-binding protein
MASVRLEDIHKTYPNGQVAVRGVDLDIADGELVVLVGPSGCGKSTVLRMVAGLAAPTQGRVLIGEEDVTDLPPQDRDIAMVFQNYALYPHKSVRDNLAFGLRMRGTRRDVIRDRVQAVAQSLGLEQVLDRKPAQLSGGQRQRVALGRAIVREPKAFLFDEPLSNLDTKLRVHTRAELSRLHRKLRATMIFVTHDQQEAMTLGDRIVVLLDGELQQVGPPLGVYRQPANVFVAGFIGSPAMNFLPCELRRDGEQFRLEGPSFAIELGGTSHPVPLRQDSSHSSLLLGVRPSDIRLVEPAGADLRGCVDVIEPLGSELLIHLTADGTELPPITLIAPAETAVALNDSVGVRFERDRLHLFDAATKTRIGL